MWPNRRRPRRFRRSPVTARRREQMATLQSSRVAPADDQDESAAAPGEPVSPTPTAAASPVVPADLLTFDLVAEFFTAPELSDRGAPEPQPVSIPAAMTVTPPESDPIVAEALHAVVQDDAKAQHLPTSPPSGP